MSGRLKIQSELKKKNKHDHFIIYFNNSKILILNDPRKFGFIDFDNTKKIYLRKYFTVLGIDALSKKLNTDYLYNKINNKEEIESVNKNDDQTQNEHYNEDINEDKCDQCEKRFGNKHGLRIHQSRKHKDIPQLDGQISDENESQSYQCVQCDIFFKEECDLRKHMEVKHEMGTGKVPANEVKCLSCMMGREAECKHVCDICGKTFSSESQLVIHRSLLH